MRSVEVILPDFVVKVNKRSEATSVCLYDTWLQGGNRYRGRTPPSTVEEIENPQEHDIENNAQNSKKTNLVQLSLIHRILSKYYKLLYQF